jgi:hypothetical protein
MTYAAPRLVEARHFVRLARVWCAGLPLLLHGKDHALKPFI